MTTDQLIDLISDYYRVRKLTKPDSKEAMDFAITEWAEARELLFAEDAKWVRNNKKEQYSDERFSEELGDMLQMILVAGLVRGLNPIDALVKKLERKMK